MNKFEKLIEYIINDEDDKARALFHDIVVEKSRDIYESIMDEDQMAMEVSDKKVDDLTDEVENEEWVHEEMEEEGEEGDEETFDITGGDNDEVGGEIGHEPVPGSGSGAKAFGDEHEEHEEIEDKVMSIDAKLDDLLAKFDEIMGDHDGMDMHDTGGAEMGGAEMGAPDMGEAEMEGSEMESEMAMEGEMPAWLKKGSAKSGSEKSGKSGSDKETSAKSGKSGSAKMEAAESGSAMSGKSGKSGSEKSGKSGSAKKSPSEIMREYTEMIEKITLEPSSYKEGDAVGAAGKKVSVNTKPGSVGPGANFGGKEVDFEGAEESPDGKPIEKPASDGYKTKNAGELIGKVGNSVGGGNEKQKPTGHEYSKEHDKEGKLAGADGSRPINAKSVQKQNTGVKR